MSEHQKTTQAVIGSQSVINPHQTVEKFVLFNADGTPREIPDQAAAQTDAPALTSAAATGGDAPTEAEYNALRTDVSNLRTTVNALLGKLRTAGIVAP